jgi:hypothetical protein
LETIWVAWLVSKAWKAMASTNVYWLATQVAKDDIRASAMRLLMVEDLLKPTTLTFDVFVHNVEALFDVSHSKRHGMTYQPLHRLPLPSLYQERDTHDLLMWPDANDYCLDTLNDYECDTKWFALCHCL